MYALLYILCLYMLTCYLSTFGNRRRLDIQQVEQQQQQQQQHGATKSRDIHISLKSEFVLPFLYGFYSWNHRTQVCSKTYVCVILVYTFSQNFVFEQD
jgi:hypothetical protein